MRSLFPSDTIPFKRWVMVTAVLCVATFGASFLVFRYIDHVIENYCAETYDLLNPRWRCEKEPLKSAEYDQLLNALLQKTEEWKKAGDISFVTIFFRDLQAGNLFNIHAYEHFAPASLLKVPVMIALLKYAETHPKILDEEIQMGEKLPSGANLTDPEQTLVPHETYTIREMLRRMIVYSDNTSKEVLRSRLEALSPGIMDQTFVDLGIALQNPDGSPYITIRSYAAMFRSLYNASYLDRVMSEEALNLLTQAEFTQGIDAGVPTGVQVAHKFGYLNVSPQEQQLHDCGIVYFPEKPYLLCVMTRGKDPRTIADVIGEISKAVFVEVSRRADNE